ncbi:MAG: hypothetical protein ACXVA2_23510 [Mucilaginibacter sp.]
MAYLRKKLERRTYSQDRYYILIKRQKSGKATFNELTELDEIVNRVPDIREKVIRESFMIEDVQDTDMPPNDTENSSSLLQQSRNHPTFWHRIRSFITRAFSSHITVIKAGDMAVLF